jgi:hypothetical protein
VANPALGNEFCLYLWRTVDAPGTLYLAPDLASAEAVCAGMMAEGYLVKAVHAASETEYKLSEGKLSPRRSATIR